MNIAVLLAGGVDPAFKMDIPKQFVNVYNKPIIVYAMQKFQSHPEVDAIMIACLKGWENMVQAYAKPTSQACDLYQSRAANDENLYAHATQP